MKILKLSPYYYPEQVSSSHLSDDLNKAYAKAGIIQENFVPTPSRGVSNEIREEYKKKKTEVLDDGNIIIHRFYMFKEGKNTIQRALRYILVNFIQFHKGKKARNIDVVFGASTPPTQGVLCAKVAKSLSKKYGHKVPFVYSLQDIFPDSLVNAKMTTKGSLIWKIGRMIEDYTYQSADKIITISEDFKNNILAKGVPEEKIVVAPNWVNTDNVYPIDRKDNVLFDRYNLDRNHFYICYSGNIGLSQNMDMLLNVAKKISDSNIRFVLIGEGAAKEAVQARIKAERISNVYMFPFQDYSEIAHVFSLGDVDIIISKPGVGGSSVPSKTWSIMAAGRPVLASFDIDSELSKLISNSCAGIVVDSGDENTLISVIKELANDADRCKIMGVNGLRYLNEHVNKEKSIRQYLNVMSEVIR